MARKPRTAPAIPNADECDLVSTGTGHAVGKHQPQRSSPAEGSRGESPSCTQERSDNPRSDENDEHSHAKQLEGESGGLADGHGLPKPNASGGGRSRIRLQSVGDGWLDAVCCCCCVVWWYRSFARLRIFRDLVNRSGSESGT